MYIFENVIIHTYTYKYKTAKTKQAQKKVKRIKRKVINIRQKQRLWHVKK